MMTIEQIKEECREHIAHCEKFRDDVFQGRAAKALLVTIEALCNINYMNAPDGDDMAMEAIQQIRESWEESK